MTKTPTAAPRSLLGLAGGALSAIHTALLCYPLAFLVPIIVDLGGMAVHAVGDMLNAGACGVMFLLALLVFALLLLVVALFFAAVLVAGILAMFAASWFAWTGDQLGLYAGAALNSLCTVGWLVAVLVEESGSAWRFAPIAALPLTAAVLMALAGRRAPDAG